MPMPLLTNRCRRSANSHGMAASRQRHQLCQSMQIGNRQIGKLLPTRTATATAHNHAQQNKAPVPLKERQKSAARHLVPCRRRTTSAEKVLCRESTPGGSRSELQRWLACQPALVQQVTAHPTRSHAQGSSLQGTRPAGRNHPHRWQAHCIVYRAGARVRAHMLRRLSVRQPGMCGERGGCASAAQALLHGTVAYRRPRGGGWGHAPWYRGLGAAPSDARAARGVCKGPGWGWQGGL